MDAHIPKRFAVGWTLLLLACLASTCGCSRFSTCRSWIHNGFKVGPEYCRPAAALEPQWIDLQSDPRIVGETVDLANWWRRLGDPTLNTLVEVAYDENLTIREAATRIRQAEAIRDIAVGNLFPQVQEAVGDFQRVKTSRNVAVPAPVRRFSQFDLGLQAAWELDFWGRFRRSIEVADANLDASIAAYDEVAVLLLANVAATYVEIRTTQERLRIAREVIELQKGSLGIADARYRAEQTNKLDVIQAQNNIDVTEAAIPLLESQLRIANNRLCVLLGIPPRDLESELPDGPIPSVSRLVQAGIPADLLRRRPDIRRTERLMRAQSARIGIAEAQLYPRISLLGSIEWQADDFGKLFNANSVFALISPGFSWSIFNYGRLRNGVELEVQRFRETVLQYQQSVLTAQREVEDAMVAFLKAQDRADELAQAVSQVNEAEQIALSLYKTGATDFNRVFLIQAFQFSQQDELVVSRAAAVLNLINVYKALGGGWEIRCPGRRGVLPEGVADAHVDDQFGRGIGELPAVDRDPSETDPGAVPATPSDQDPSEKAEPLPEKSPAETERERRLRELLEPPLVPRPEPPQEPELDERLKRLLEESQSRAPAGLESR